MKKEAEKMCKRTGRSWVIGLLLFLALLPIWPVEGLWLGLPAWAVLAVTASGAMSLFIAWWIKHHWPVDDVSPSNPITTRKPE